MVKVLCEKDGRIGQVTLNRPEVMNAIDLDLPRKLTTFGNSDAESAISVNNH